MWKLFKVYVLEVKKKPYLWIKAGSNKVESKIMNYVKNEISVNRDIRYGQVRAILFL